MRCGVSSRLAGRVFIVLSALLLPGLVQAQAPTPDCAGCEQAPPAIPAKVTIDILSGDAADTAPREESSGLPWGSRGSRFVIHIVSSSPAIKLSSLGRIAVELRFEGEHGNSGSWFPAEQTQILKQNDGELHLSAMIPQSLPSAPSHLDQVFGHAASARHTGFSLVPVLDVRVMLYPATPAGVPASTDALLDATVPMGVTSETFSAGLALATTLLFLFVLSRVKAGNLDPDASLLRIVSNGTGAASLSQFQIILWMAVIGASAVYVMALSGDLIVLSQGTLVLLGVSGAAALGTNLKTKRDLQNGAAPDAPKAPEWSDLVMGDNGQIDMSRVQMLFFTCISAVFVAMTVAAREVIPAIPESYLLLMGISNGVYFLNKFTVPTPPAGTSPVVVPVVVAVVPPPAPQPAE